MTMYAVKRDDFEFRAKGIESMQDITGAYFGADGSEPITILQTEHEDEARAELAKHRSSASYEQGISFSLICGEICFVEEYEADENGEFLNVSSVILADWESDIFAAQ